MTHKYYIIIIHILIFVLYLVPIHAVLPNVDLNVSLSWDNGTTFTEEKKQSFICKLFDSVKYYGSITDLWGRNWTREEILNLVVNVNYSKKVGRINDVRLDHVQVNIYYELTTAPSIVYIYPTPPNNSNVGSTFNITTNITNDIIITGCLFESNLTGTLTNESMYLDNKQCSIKKNYVINGTSFIYRVYATSQDNITNSSFRRVAYINSNNPFIALYSPKNNSINVSKHRILNFSVSDYESDDMNISMYVNDTLVYYNRNTTNVTVMYNYSVPDISSDSDGLYALYRLNIDNRYGDNEKLLFEYTQNSDSNLNGTHTSTTYNPIGKVGGSFDFGTGASATIGTGIEFGTICDNGCTFVIWAYSISNSSKSYLISKSDSSPPHFFFNAGLNSFGVPIFMFSDSSTSYACGILTGNTSINRNRWYHYAYVWNTTQQLIYLDGVLVGVNDCSISVSGWHTDPQATLIGANHIFSPSIGFAWTGSIDEVSIWNRTLTHEEIINMTILTDGNYTWNVSASDGGDIIRSDTLLFTIGALVDTSAPNITLIEPVNNRLFSDGTLINFSWIVNDNLDSSLFCNLSIINVINFSDIISLNNSITSITISNFNDGGYDWFVRCIDDGNNTANSIIRSFVVNSTIFDDDGVLSTELILNLCPTTLQGQILIYLLFLVPILFIFIAFIMRMQGMALMNSIWIMLMSLFIVGCSVTMGLVVGVLGLILVVSSVMMK